ncbi:MAG: hypothetical protein AAF801_04995 [Pseudomonadota bacterium]
MSEISSNAGSRMSTPAPVETTRQSDELFRDGVGKLGRASFESTERTPMPPPKKIWSSIFASINPMKLFGFRRSTSQVERLPLPGLSNNQPDANTERARYKHAIPSFDWCVRHMQIKNETLSKSEAEDVVFKIVNTFVEEGYTPLEAGVGLNRMIEADKRRMATQSPTLTVTKDTTGNTKENMHPLPKTLSEKSFSLPDGLFDSSPMETVARNSAPKSLVDNDLQFAMKVKDLEIMMDTKRADDAQDKTGGTGVDKNSRAPNSSATETPDAPTSLAKAVSALHAQLKAEAEAELRTQPPATRRDTFEEGFDAGYDLTKEWGDQ